jgi:hypothetical protein
LHSPPFPATLQRSRLPLPADPSAEDLAMARQGHGLGYTSDATPRPLPCSIHVKFWESRHGTHLICEVCHPPAFERIVVARFTLDPATGRLRSRKRKATP